MTKKTMYILLAIIGVLVLVIIYLVTHVTFCGNKNAFENIRTAENEISINLILENWQLVVESPNAELEKINISKLKVSLKSAEAPFKANVIDKNGLISDWNLYKGSDEAINKINLIVFLAGKEIQTSPDWQPKDIENFWTLFEE